MQVELNIRVREDVGLGIHVSWCPALNLFSQGTSRAQAIEAIHDTVNQFLSACEFLAEAENGVVYELVT